MKKRIKLIVAVAMVAALAIGLGACSCSGSKGLTDFGWYKAAVPEGYKDAKEGDKAGVKFVNEQDQDQIIKVYNESTSSSKPNAAAMKADYISKASDRYRDKGQIKIGNYTWEVLGYTWNGGKESVMLFADADDKHVIHLDFFCNDENSDVAQYFTGSFTYVGEQTKK